MIPLGLNLSAFAEEKNRKRGLFREKYKIPETEMVVAVVGRLTAIKNMPMFMEVISAFQKKEMRHNLKFFIVGDGEEKEKLYRQLQILKIPYETEHNLTGMAPVIFTSWILEMDMVMNGIDILCLTSLNEGTPVSILEAMAAGKPVLTTNAGSVAEIVQNGISGLVTPVHAVADFVTALEQLALNSELCKQMGAKGRQLVLELCDPVKASRKLEQLYESPGNRSGFLL
jgi:glycosyltransferase involved in cell wall biosynthesis